MSKISDPASLDLDHYDPDQSLKTIALSEAAEKASPILPFARYRDGHFA